MVILFSGFMGSGKSFYLHQMKISDSELVGFDLDDDIFEKFGEGFSSLGKLIESRGWEWFRKIESECLEKSLSSLSEKNRAVLSLGGGALTTEKNIEIIRKYSAFVVWLDTPWKLCLDRIKEDSNRPLSKMSEEELFKLFEIRREIYRKNSDLSLNLVEKFTCFDELERLLLTKGVK